MNKVKHEYPKERKKPERIPLNKERYDMICVQVRRLFWEMCTTRTGDQMDVAEAWEKVGYARNSAENLCELLNITSVYREEDDNEETD